MDVESLKKAIEGVSYIIHVASPISTKKTKLYDLIEPCKRSMEAMIEASIANKVKRIVVTSSDMAIVGSFFRHYEPGVGANEMIEYTEKDFAPIEQCNDPYGKSKIMQ